MQGNLYLDLMQQTKYGRLHSTMGHNIVSVQHDVIQQCAQTEENTLQCIKVIFDFSVVHKMSSYSTYSHHIDVEK